MNRLHGLCQQKSCFNKVFLYTKHAAMVIWRSCRLCYRAGMLTCTRRTVSLDGPPYTGLQILERLFLIFICYISFDWFYTMLEKRTCRLFIDTQERCIFVYSIQKGADLYKVYCVNVIKTLAIHSNRSYWFYTTKTVC